jgi:hypothetical protein
MSVPKDYRKMRQVAQHYPNTQNNWMEPNSGFVCLQDELASGYGRETPATSSPPPSQLNFGESVRFVGDCDDEKGDLPAIFSTSALGKYLSRLHGKSEFKTRKEPADIPRQLPRTISAVTAFADSPIATNTTIQPEFQQWGSLLLQVHTRTASCAFVCSQNTNDTGYVPVCTPLCLHHCQPLLLRARNILFSTMPPSGA